MDDIDIKNKFYMALDNPAGWQHISHFYQDLKKLRPDTALDFLINIFIENNEPNKLYFTQEVAGGCLWKLRPSPAGKS